MAEQTWAWDNVDESNPLANCGDSSQSLFAQRNSVQYPSENDALFEWMQKSTSTPNPFCLVAVHLKSLFTRFDTGKEH